MVIVLKRHYGKCKVALDFMNRINEPDSLDVLTFANIYNVSGGAAADVNNDDFPGKS